MDLDRQIAQLEQQIKGLKKLLRQIVSELEECRDAVPSPTTEDYHAELAAITRIQRIRIALSELGEDE